MTVVPKPIPAFYAVYILRSTVRHASLYIGSTPNPPRRLKQHNGEARGGANRTAREQLRPWEMVGLVSGFPSMVAALKFEWALGNPHLSLHIPAESRISVSTQRKRGGRPRKPIPSLSSVLSNVHLLLRVPSFARWPLKLHFFAPDVHKAWMRMTGSSSIVPLRDTIDVVTDFPPATEEAADSTTQADAAAEKPCGIHALPLEYDPIKDVVEKGHSVFGFEREGKCVVCGCPQDSHTDLLALCSNNGCEAVGHLSCWSKHVLGQCGADDMIPVRGSCPSCMGEVRWEDMMKELTLRLRGQKDIEKLLKPKRKRIKAKKTAEE